MRANIALMYEYLLKMIYGVDYKSTTLHFTHGAHADIIRNMLGYEWVENSPESASFDDIFSYGQSVGEVVVYLQESLQHAIEHLPLEKETTEVFEQYYSSLPGSSINTICKIIEDCCTSIGIINY